ncbi:MAG TPA: ABC transporter permease [bacterium]|nr:ABC transporter permease [bacterium]
MNEAGLPGGLAAARGGAPEGRRLRSLAWVWLRSPSLVIGLVIIAAVVAAAMTAPHLAPYSPIRQNYAAAVQPPSAAHPLGTDKFGRDQLSRILYGTRIDLTVGFLCTVVPLVIGVAVGAVSGYYGGLIDTIFMRVIDIQVAFPFYVLLIAIVAILGPGLINMYYALILVGWVAFARLVRGEVLIAKQLEYALAARAIGAGDLRVIVRHLLPNVVGPALVFAMSAAVLNILAGASLSFLGLGVQPPTPEWGAMIAESREYVLTAWWLPTFPGLAITVVGIAFSLIGDGLAGFLRRRRP